MSKQVPEGWTQYRVGDLATPKRGITYNSSNLAEEGQGYPLYINMKSFLKDGGYNKKGEKYFDGAYSENNLLLSNELVFANTDVTPSGDIIGVPALIPKEKENNNILFSHHVTALTLSGVARKEFLYYLFCLGEYRLKMRRIGRGTTVLMLDMDALKKIHIKIPPLPEQQKIISILASVDDVVEITESQISKLHDLKKGILQELLTKGVGHTEFKDSPVGRIPKKWKLYPVGQLFSIQLGKMLNKNAKLGVSPYPYLANRNVQWGRVDLSSLPSMDFNEKERRKFDLRRDDLLVCEGGEVGRSALWVNESICCFYQKAIHRLRAKDKAVVPRFYLYFMEYIVKSNYLQNFVSQTSIAHLTKENLESIAVPLPDTEEQKVISSAILSVESQIRNRQKKRDYLLRVKNALMQDLLSGEVRVGLGGAK